jgi:hypothetical protein
VFVDVSEKRTASVYVIVLYPEDGDSKFVRNVDKLIPDRIASHKPVTLTNTSARIKYSLRKIPFKILAELSAVMTEVISWLSSVSSDDWGVHYRQLKEL